MIRVDVDSFGYDGVFFGASLAGLYVILVDSQVIPDLTDDRAPAWQGLNHELGGK